MRIAMVSAKRLSSGSPFTNLDFPAGPVNSVYFHVIKVRTGPSHQFVGQLAWTVLIVHVPSPRPSFWKSGPLAWPIPTGTI